MGGLTRALAARAVQALLVALVVGIACFAMVRLLPGDMAFRIAAGRYGIDLVSGAAADAVRVELGLDRPWWQQLGAWLGGLIRFDLGVSLVSGDPVVDELKTYLGHTILLAVVALGISVLVGPPLGAWLGARAGSAADRAGLVASAVLRALPAFVVGIGLILVFAVGLGWLPAAGVGGWQEVVLPAVTLALGLAAVSSRVARDAVAAALHAEPAEFARRKGLPEGAVRRRHVWRNAAVPVVAYLGVQLVALIEGVVIVETLFAWPGIGHALVHAVVARDVPMVQGTALVMGLLFVALNALVDLLTLLIDPRRRSAA
ncbi:ABC transporter permease [Roseomonas sp. AR75]|uniref:ABC transporter permease n=1 Tax=Roseomonas sp. AR75 TaxID=2562311 RepID=UPI0010C13979|nr:ABC transporter permease [Roseomonas sp. AR75]